MASGKHEKRPYLWVFLWLAVLTIIEVLVTYLGLSQMALITVLGLLAISKALLVALYYMHLRYDNPILALIGGFPFILSVIMIIILLTDRTLVGGLLGG
ncbi:cytochrome C oxidase subunit IV family protein [Chloroflexi bacterium TSY]|nr:cytochrome C oxidase subunit IV family protein [Chloroflexi bacterium TSY]